MPTVTLNKKVFEKLVGKKLPIEKLKERISMLGTDLEKVDGSEITVEIFPNRPDMLSEQGFARAFSSFIGLKKGLRKYDVKKSLNKIFVKNLPKEWPYVVACIVKGLKFDDEKIREIIQIQEKLGMTLLRRRKKGGLGLYPLEKITFPVTFKGEDPDKIKFQPLEFSKEITGKQILSKHPTGREYANICKNWKKFPVFVDAKGIIMSMPPIINSHTVGKIDTTTKDVFIEATGTDLNILMKALNILVTSLADMGGSIYSIDLIYPGSYKFKKVVAPNLQPKEMKINIIHVNKMLGLELKENDIKKLLEKMGYGYKNKKVLIPGYRVDVLHEVDLIEDIAIAYGYENFKEIIPNVATVAELSPFNSFVNKISEILVGLGIQEVNTYHLLSKQELNDKMLINMPAIKVGNAPEEYNYLRSWITPSLIKVLSKNKHHDYPQKIFETTTVFKKDDSEEINVKEFFRLGITISSSVVDFTTIKQIFDALMCAFDIKYEMKSVEHKSFVNGRVARVSVEGKDVAYVGEIHPAVLENWGLEMPVAAFELNVSELFEIIKNK